jgi:hypothetical protein
MSAGSGASNLGYSEIAPLSNVNGQYVNVGSTNYSGSFSSNEIPGPPGLSGAKSNIDAAAGRVPGICSFKGGAKKLKTKIKNITKQYKKMKGKSKKMKSLKNKLRRNLSSRQLSRGFMGGKTNRSRRNRSASRQLSRGFSSGKTRRRNRQRGGYAQYQNNAPITPTYQVAGIPLSYDKLALANPPPVTLLANCTNCVDNYNHYENGGFSSKGH